MRTKEKGDLRSSHAAEHVSLVDHDTLVRLSPLPGDPLIDVDDDFNDTDDVQFEVR
jgi:hypothetical protein